MRIRTATRDDVSLILTFIRELAEYEKLAHEAVATEEAIAATLFGPKPSAEVLIAELRETPVGFALFFPNYSTFLGKPGIYLEDVFVRPAARAQGVGRALLSHLARLAVERGCGRLEWAVLNWNVDAIGFYRRIGAIARSEWTTYQLTGNALAALGREDEETT